MPRSYNNGVSTALDWDKLIPDVALSAVEVLTYFPKHLRWPSILIRLYKAGFRGPDMAKGQLHARGMLTKAEFQRRKDALRHAILAAGRKFFDDESFTQGSYANDPRLNPIVSASYPNGDCIAHYDGTELTQALSTLDTAPPTLQQVANGVINPPTGEDAGVLTQVLRWAAAQDQLANYTTDDVASLAMQLPEFVTEPAAAHGSNWDQAGLGTIQGIPNP